MTTLTSRPRGSDFLKSYWDDRYNFESVRIKNMSGTNQDAGAIKVGTPLNNNSGTWETLDDAAESSADGWVVDDRVIPALANNATTDLEYKVLVRGPAIVNLDAIAPALDGNNAYVLATMKTRMEAMNPPIVCLRDAGTSTTQTT